MEIGLRITVVEPDDDYLGIEICASNGRYSGATRIYAGLTDLSEFAEIIAGFPINSGDERRHEFGTRDPKVAGGFCGLRLRCVDQKGHAALDLAFEDWRRRHSKAIAEFTLRVEPAGIDRFVRELRAIEKNRKGEAVLASA